MRCEVTASVYSPPTVSRRRKNAESHISIDDVVAACGTSKRLLEKNFRAVLNTTAVRELQRVRLECVKKKLEESTLSLSRICESCGFNDESHLKKIFKRPFGMTMSACRKAART